MIARKVDERAIAELAKEREILNRVTLFFVSTVKHYRLEPSVSEADEDIDQGGLINANARLMQALRRTLNKLMEALAKHKREEKERAKSQVIADTGNTMLSDFAKGNLTKAIMHDRLYEIEKKYASALVIARIFHDARKKPPMLETRSQNLDTAMSQPPPQLPAPVPVATTVSILANGAIDTAMSAGEVVQKLGLAGNGVGGRVGIRDVKLLTGIEFLWTVSDITIVELNPPDAKTAVRAIGPNGYEPTTKVMTVDVEDLIPAPRLRRSVSSKML